MDGNNYFLPTIARGFILGLLIVAAVVVVVHAQQQTRTTCYHPGSTEICKTFDSHGAIISKSRCYKSGRDTRCDTQNFSGTRRTAVDDQRRQRRAKSVTKSIPSPMSPGTQHAIEHFDISSR